MPAVIYTVHGRVQGVGFRFFVQREAQRLSLKGWVRNMFDGTVEVLAIGQVEDLEKFRSRLAAGPPGARVENVSRAAVTLAPEDMRQYRSFAIEGDA